jgi:hypothetical protein
MSRKTQSIGGVLLVLIATISACSPNSAAEPTTDPNAIYTSAAVTVQAQLTKAAEGKPTATYTMQPPTETPTLEPSPMQTDSSAPGEPVETAAQPSLPTATATYVPPVAAAKYELVSQNPADGTTLPPDYKFDMIWTIKNTGTTTWTEDYTVQFFIGDRIAGTKYTITSYNFRESVEPGKTTNIIVDMMTASTAGEYYSWWKIKDENGNNFGDLDVTISVGGPTMTPTP